MTHSLLVNGVVQLARCTKLRKNDIILTTWQARNCISPTKTYRFATPTLKQLSVAFFSCFFFDDPCNQNIENLQLYIRLFHTYFIFQLDEDWLINKEVYVRPKSLK